tara:strand:- start:514 stop:855 length:342 start_codon:yes stop_codon:yes gene_type:complete
MNKEQLITILLLTATQVIVWFQLNGQLIWKWFKDNPLTLALLGIPISYIFIMTTKIGYPAFGEQLWPIRLLGFATGMITFPIITWLFLGEGLSTQTIISIILAGIIMIIQLTN